MEIFNYEFMRRALLVGFLLSIFIPCIGILMVSKRLSMVGDALSHISLAGISIGILFNFNPLLAAIIAGIISGLGLEWLSKQFGKYNELGIAIMTSFGIGLAGLLSSFIPNASNFNNFLFGSIVSISDDELKLTILTLVLVFTCFFLFYKEFFLIAFDVKSARLLGVNVKLMNSIMMILTALTVSVASKTVGALIISSLMVIPVAAGMQVAKSYRQNVIYSIIFGMISMMSGLFLAYYGRLKPGGSIVMVSILILIVILIINKIRYKGVK